jgi:CDP-glucose 4,6-dehydratase
LRSYEEPLLTLETNVMGTANLLEAVREYCAAGNTCAVVIITSDKCYANQEWVHGYRESDPLGGSDPYSMSKGAAELVVASWRHSFFPARRFDQHRVSVASARAGNVIGGGDWTRDRIVVDCIHDLTAAKAIRVRNPHAVRPWQHVLEPLSGYLLLGSKLLNNDADNAARFGSAWNFGPSQEGVWTVGRLVDRIISLWGGGEWEDRSDPNARPETRLLALAIDKAVHELGWTPVWTVDRALEKTVGWFQQYRAGSNDPRAFTLTQIDEYTADAGAAVRQRLPAAIANT